MKIQNPDINKKIFILLFFTLTIFFIIPQENKKIKEKLDEVLSQKKYHYVENKKKEKKNNLNWFTGLAENIEKILTKIINGLKKLHYIFIIFILTAASILVAFLIKWIIKNVNLSFKKERDKKEKKSYNEKGNLNYNIDLLLAKKLIDEKKYREAISITINALWLFLHFKNILSYKKSRTNREYLECLTKFEEYKNIRHLVLDAEKKVYLKDNINERDCSTIFEKVTKLVSE